MVGEVRGLPVEELEWWWLQSAAASGVVDGKETAYTLPWGKETYLQADRQGSQRSKLSGRVSLTRGSHKSQKGSFHPLSWRSTPGRGADPPSMFRRKEDTLMGRRPQSAPPPHSHALATSDSQLGLWNMARKCMRS